MEPEVVMDHREIETGNVAELYATGRLAAAEEAAFEEHLVACSECRERVAWADDLRRSLTTVAVEDLEHSLRAGALAWLARGRGWRAALVLCVAAALALPVAWLLRDRTQLRRQLDQASTAGAAGTGERPAAAAARAGSTESMRLAAEGKQLAVSLATERSARQRLAEQLGRLTRPQANVAIFSLGLVRGEDARTLPENRVEIGPGPEWIVLSVELPPAAQRSYRGTLLDRVGATLWRGEGLQAGAGDSLALGLYSTLLPPGRYRLRFTGEDRQAGATSVVDVPFEVVRRH